MNESARIGTSRLKGVCWYKAGLKWSAQIRLEGHKFHLGLWNSEVDAAQAYDVKARELGWPEYALNFPRAMVHV
jgi:hypothetical protein